MNEIPNTKSAEIGNNQSLRFRSYGARGKQLILLHGGPGAPGYLAPLAGALQDSYRILEPYQRGSSETPLTVATHIEDLRAFIQTQCDGAPPVLAGHSWGAMLALAFASAHPGLADSLVLIGCGTFDLASRAKMNELRRQRWTESLGAREARLRAKISDPNRLLKAIGHLHQLADSVQLIRQRDHADAFDARAHEETWADMLRLQANGTYPAAFSAIQVPVIMLHGAEDPHPGRMIRDSLRPCLPKIEYHEFARCGHYPWLEVHARDEFIHVLKSWLERRT